MDQRLRDIKDRVQPGDRELLGSILERVGDKWSVMVLAILTKGPRRFGDLAEIVPNISRRMLTVTLRQLERDGLVTRIVHSDVPPWFEYAVTDLGLSLREPLATILEWALDHREEILGNRVGYDASHSQS